MVENTREAGSHLGQQIGEGIDRGLGSAAQKAREVKDTAMNYGRQGYDYAAQKGQQAREYTEGYIRTNPWYAIGIAVGVGVLLGMLLRGGGGRADD